MKRKSSFTIRFTSKDIELINYIKSQWQSGHPIHTDKKWGCHTLSVYSKKMAEKLISFGVVPQKTFRTKYPSIPSKFNYDFIRGVFDGDGCVWTTRDIKKIRLQFAGSFELLDKIAEILAVEVRIGRIFPIPHHSSSKITNE